MQSRVSSQAGLSAALSCVDMTRPRSGLDLVKSRVVPTLFLVPQLRKRDMNFFFCLGGGGEQKSSQESHPPMVPLCSGPLAATNGHLEFGNWELRFFPEALRRVLLLKAAANFTCQLLMPTSRELLHLPTSLANFSRVISSANFSCQLFESYFTCQLLMPTFRELLHLPTSHASFSRVTSPANFSCQLFGCYLIILKTQANFSSLPSYRLFGCYLIILKTQANFSFLPSHLDS